MGEVHIKGLYEKLLGGKEKPLAEPKGNKLKKNRFCFGREGREGKEGKDPNDGTISKHSKRATDFQTLQSPNAPNVHDISKRNEPHLF